MKLKNIICEATAALKRNWLRSILTILGISVGVGAFICVVAVGNAGSSSIEKQLQNLGDNFIWIEAGSRARNGVRYGARGDRTLILGDATAIVGQVPLVKSMSPNADGHTQVVYAGENWVTMFRGVTPVFLKIRRWNMKLGAFFTEADVDATAPVCVLGQTVVDNLFGNEDPIGKTIRVHSMPCKVVGVLQAKGFSATGQDQDDFIVMPFTTVQKRITGTFWLDDTFCSAVSREAMPEATKQIVALLRERHHPPGGRSTGSACDQPDSDHTFGKRCVFVLARGWHRHHEYHAGVRHSTHARDWAATRRRRERIGRPTAIP